MRIWGDVESAVASLIRKLLDTDITTAQIVIRTLSNMQAQRELAGELGKHRIENEKDIRVLDKLMERVKAGATRRNRIVHGAWILMIEMGLPPRQKPLLAKSQRWLRQYRPAQDADFKNLMSGNQKMMAAYQFWPEQIRKYAEENVALAADINAFTEKVALAPPIVPLPVEW